MKKLIVAVLMTLALLWAALTMMPTHLDVYQIFFDNPQVVEFHNKIKHLDNGDTLHLYTSGPGGSTQGCIAIIHMIQELQERGVYVITEVLGEAYSGNAFVWLAGDERIVRPEDQLMFHESAAYSLYGLKILDPEPDAKKRLSKQNEFLLPFSRLQIPTSELFTEMFDDDENYYNGQELYDMGVATKLIRTD